jgi:hypothetical protein
MDTGWGGIHSLLPEVRGRASESGEGGSGLAESAYSPPPALRHDPRTKIAPQGHHPQTAFNKLSNAESTVEKNRKLTSEWNNTIRRTALASRLVSLMA